MKWFNVLPTMLLSAVLSLCCISEVFAKTKKEIKMERVDKVVKFLQDAKVFYIATTEESQPRVRPFGVVVNIDGKVSICTGSFKNVYKQIIKNPKVEISAMVPDGKWMRLTGVLEDNTSDINKQRFFDIMPGLKDRYKNNLQDFVVFSFSKARVTIENMEGVKETIDI
ncbi:MAG: pyridoxamine 5'-phosphate oxidase family protein [Elusimicrobiota bacterium]|jgi:uncharacterized pyridoxamine 5'-phosphate oxidase family protein|nr:pyridoxamine 5'-phosphate oxidase family protein [Elusimicrobiota bacterium]